MKQRSVSMARLALVLATGLAGTAASQATVVRGAPPPKPASVRAAAQAHPASAAASLDLIDGRITAIDRKLGTLTIGGRTVALHAARLQIFGPHGGRQTAESLQPGMQVRFALEPGAADPRRIVLIYLQPPQR